MKRLAIVIPVYNESAGLKELVRELDIALASNLSKYKVDYFFVNDGSKDNSLLTLKELSKENPRVSYLNFTRNFGKEIAITAGLNELPDEIDAAIVMDADLQHPPGLIPTFLEAWEEGYKSVCAIRKKTEKKKVLRNLGSYFFYKLMKHLSDLEIKPGSTDFRLIDKEVISQFKRFTEKNRMFRGIIDWLGYRCRYIPFEAPKRFAGEPTYSFYKLFLLALNGLTTFSIFPLRLTVHVGLVFSGLSIITLISMVISHILMGWTYITPSAYFLVMNTLIMGISLICLGIISIYLGHVHTESVNRPLYAIEERQGSLSKKVLPS